LTSLSRSPWSPRWMMTRPSCPIRYVPHWQMRVLSIDTSLVVLICTRADRSPSARSSRPPELIVRLQFPTFLLRARPNLKIHRQSRNRHWTKLTISDRGTPLPQILIYPPSVRHLLASLRHYVRSQIGASRRQYVVQQPPAVIFSKPRL
jgi:hypothetical protein